MSFLFVESKDLTGFFKGLFLFLRIFLLFKNTLSSGYGFMLRLFYFGFKFWIIEFQFIFLRGEFLWV